MVEGTEFLNDVIYIDTQAPSGVNIKVNGGKSVETKAGVYFQEQPVLTVEASDNGSGIEGFYLNNKKSKTGVWTLSENEDYVIYIVDKVGNKTKEYSLANVMGWKTSKIRVDNDTPQISASKPQGGVDNWYKEDQVYNIGITDTAISSVNITVNGKVVESYTDDGTDRNEMNFTVSTSGIEARSDGSYTIQVECSDRMGNNANWSDTIYIDRVSPKVTRFVFSGIDVSDGAVISGGNKYGFFSSGSASVKIYADDGKGGSGLANIVAVLKSSGGSDNTVSVDASEGAGVVTIPSGFKGTISAHAVDRVGNVGEDEQPDGIVSESSNMHMNSITMEISLPDTDKKSRSGLPLYNSAINATLRLGCDISGIKSVSWGVGDKEYGRSTVTSEGNIAGDGGVSILKSDKNLVLELSRGVQITDNGENLSLWAKVEDRLGNVSEDSKKFSVDTEVPVYEVTYSGEEPGKDGFVKGDRTATIRIKDLNFIEDGVKFLGEFGEISSWVQDASGYWVTTMTFKEDKNYEWQMTVTDGAGNQSETYTSEKFSIDNKAPEVTITFDNNDTQGKNFYKKGRTATILVIDTNFYEDGCTFKGDGKLGKWEKVEKGYMTTVDCTKDGKYSFEFKCKDKAGNESDTVKVDEFIVDTEKPALEVTGVENGITYHQDIKFEIKITDKYLDGDNIKVEFTGVKNKKIDVLGRYDEKKGVFEGKFEGFDEDDEKFDDSYTLKVTANDKAKNTVSKILKFSLNRFGSQFMSENDIDIFGNYLKSVDEDIIISEVNAERLDITKCRIVVILDGKTLSLGEDDCSIREIQNDSDWRYEYIVNKEVFDKDGKYQIQIYSTSEEDEIEYNLVTEEYAFILDSTEPEILITGIENGEKYRGYSMDVIVEVRDYSGISDIDITVNGKKADYTEDEGMYTLKIVESNKRQDINVTVTDKAGNISKESINDFLLTSNIFTFIVNRAWFGIAVAIIVVVIILIILWIVRARVSMLKSEKEEAEEQKKLYDRSRSSSSESSSSDGN